MLRKEKHMYISVDVDVPTAHWNKSGRHEVEVSFSCDVDEPYDRAKLTALKRKFEHDLVEGLDAAYAGAAK